jgi:hypothetical protein
MNFQLNNNTILIIGLIIISIVSLIYNNEYIATTVIGALAGFLAKDKLETTNIGDNDDTA